MDSYPERFGGVCRLFGAEASDRLRHAHVCIIGLGGVGSWTAEALARTGIGRITLVDFDEVDLSNTNRQLHALQGTYGRPKVEVMAERIRAIHPECQVDPQHALFAADTAAPLLAPAYDHVVDAIDRTAAKCLLIAACRDRGLPLITAGAAGGRRDPTRIRVDDLSRVTRDRLLHTVRSRLRAHYGFPRDPQQACGLPCVYSPEPILPPPDTPADAPPDAQAEEGGNRTRAYGTVACVTGAFGLAAAAYVTTRLAEGHGRSRSDPG